jgi:hypothetical protein
MWVCIRPGVVRSANEKKVKREEPSCPIHGFDGSYQLLRSAVSHDCGSPEKFHNCRDPRPRISDRAPRS